ncbi:MAG: biopolymer transporter ExbD [Acidobacteria bacterium]|nr:biopolymer transporter ExbD [Acidobacteriota bacterium]
MKLRKGARIESYVPTAPMADIAFLLLVFFMVTSTFPVDRSMVNLPRAELRFQIEDKDAAWIIAHRKGEGVVELRVTDGKIMSQPLQKDIPFPVDRLEGWIFTQINASPNKLFIMKIDRDIPYRYVDQILNAIKSTNAVKNIVFLSDAKSGT